MAPFSPLTYVPYIHTYTLADTLMAPSKAIFDYAVKALETFMEIHFSTRDQASITDSTTTDEDEIEEFEDAEEDVDLIEFPSEGTNLEIIFWIILYPLRFLMHYTVPDVRQSNRLGESTSTIGQAYLATVMCLVWLIIGSYAMVASLEALAELLDIPDAVVGVTVSAAGTCCVLFLNMCRLLRCAWLTSLFSLVSVSYRYIPSELCCIQSSR